MIEFIFTIDYEIYGNGQGSLDEFVYLPVEKLRTIFQKYSTRFVIFVEVAELEMIETNGSDPGLELVKQQLRSLFKEGYELGLHVHPWWYNGRYSNGKWFLDYSEYNLCSMPAERIGRIVDRSLSYLRYLLGVADFTPLSYRAGHLLFQPSRILANVLTDRGIRVDSSVYKGGRWRQHKLNYCKALTNGYYWKFRDDANVPDPEGSLIEVPIYTQMIPTWKMFSSKRLRMQGLGSSTAQTAKKMFGRLLDRLRLFQPLKLDFCQMTIDEIKKTVDLIMREDELSPTAFKPIVAIGHTKELSDLETVEFFMSYLDQNKIPLATLRDVYHKCTCLE